MSRPITVVGGGLAGLSLGIVLVERGVEVELYERRRYPFHRVCGEFISGVSDQVLIDLGIRDCFGDAVRIESMAWFMRDRLLLEQALPRAATGISRYTLDARLAEKASAMGVQLHQGAAFNRADGEGLVWASGKTLDTRSRWIGLSAHFEGLEVDRLEMHCGKCGYLGISPIERGRVNVTGLFQRQAGLKAHGLDLIHAYLAANGSCELAQRLAAARSVSGSFVAIAGFEFGAQGAGGFALGDRSLLIPPFAGNGMSMAFEASAQAAPVLSDYARERTTWAAALERYAAAQRRAFGLRMQVATRLHPVLLSNFGLRMLGTLAVAGILPTQRLFNALR